MEDQARYYRDLGTQTTGAVSEAKVQCVSVSKQQNSVQFLNINCKI